MQNKLPKVYYGYKKLRSMWERQPMTNPDREFMISALTDSIKMMEDEYLEYIVGDEVWKMTS